MMLRDACSIPDPDSDTLIVTGGEHTLSTVSRCGVMTRATCYCALYTCPGTGGSTGSRTLPPSTWGDFATGAGATLPADKGCGEYN